MVSIAISAAGLVSAALAVVFSFRVAGPLRRLARGVPYRDDPPRNFLERRVMVSIACATVAGMAQGVEGDWVVALVWVMFVAVQCANLGSVSPRGD